MSKIWEQYKLRVRQNCLGDFTRPDGLEYWRNKLFAIIITYLLPLGLIILLASSVVVYALNIQSLFIAYFSFGVAISVISLYSGLSITVRKYLFLTLIYVVAAILIFHMGVLGAGLTYLFGVTVFALLILPPKAGVVTIFVNIGICLFQAILIHQQIADYPLRENYQVASWLAISFNSVLLSIVAVIFIPMLFSGLQYTIESQRELKQNLIIHKDELEGSLSEKDTLLAEIHHRVKNNLAVVSGMLQLQSFKETDEQMRKKLLDSTLRIKSMANIHEQLYRSHSFSNMAFDAGLRNLTQTIFETLDSGTTINTDFELDPIQLNINQAVPCSLIVNEVLTNTIKHAFGPMEEGLVSIHLTKDHGQLHLKITDNGDGFPDDLNRAENNSLGMELIDTLAIQLEADYTYENRENAKGTIFELKFKISDSPGSSAT
jgi:two-component sensor histidine kinase